MNIKKLSIITINFNNLHGLQKTVNSVLNQTFKDFDFVIVDGGSTDGSKQYIENHKADFSYWISEIDDGIYHAMNKGIEKANGEYCFFLNSGDYLLTPNVLELIFLDNPTEDIIYGNLRSNYRNYIYPETITMKTFINGTIPHQASLIKTKLFKLYGNYQTQYEVIADWVFFMEAILLNNTTYKHLDIFVSFFEHGGISTDSRNLSKINFDRINVLKKLFPKFYPDYVEMQEEVDCLRRELSSYKNSKIIRFAKAIQNKITLLRIIGTNYPKK